MYQHLFGLKNRVRRLEVNGRCGEVTFEMEDGTQAALHGWEVVSALADAVQGRQTPRATILTHAVTAGDGSHLHELVRALMAGPVVTTDVTPTEETIQ